MPSNCKLLFTSELCIDLKQSVNLYLRASYSKKNHEACYKISDLSHLFRNFLYLVMSFQVDRIRREFFFLTKVWTNCSEAPLSAKHGENILFNKLFDFKKIFSFQFSLTSCVECMCACLWRSKAMTSSSLTFFTLLPEAGQFANEDGQLWQVWVNSVPGVQPQPLDDRGGCLASWHFNTFQGSKLWTSFLLDKHSIH